MSTRLEKINSLLQKEIAQYLRDESPEGITGVVTITSVDATADLEYAKVFFSVIGQKPEEVSQILQANIYEIQGTLNRRLSMRRVPRISFVSDQSGEYAANIRRIMRDLPHTTESNEEETNNESNA